MTESASKQYLLASQIQLPCAIKLLGIKRPTTYPVLRETENIFSQTDIDDMIIEVQFFAGPFEEKNANIPFTTHLFSRNHFETWQKSHIMYSQLAINCKKPRKFVKKNEISDIAAYLNAERAKGPHIVITIRSPSQKISRYSGNNNNNSYCNTLFNAEPIIAQGVLSLVDGPHTKVRQGRQCVRLFPHSEYGNLENLMKDNNQWITSEQDVLMHIAQEKLNLLTRLHAAPWLDDLTRNKLTQQCFSLQVNKERQKYSDNNNKIPEALIGHFLIELPSFHTEEVYLHFAPQYDEYWTASNLPGVHQSEYGTRTRVKEQDVKPVGKTRIKIENIIAVRDHMTKLNSCDKKYEGPIEEKYRTISWNMQPSFEEQQNIHKIISYPNTRKLTDDEKNLLWTFRRYISLNGEALKKFIFAPLWNNNPSQHREALSLIAKWTDVPPKDGIQIIQACFHDETLPEEIYRKAIGIIARIPNLQNYLIELVQVLAFDAKFADTPLFELLSARAFGNIEFSNYFFWYLRAESALSTVYEYFFKRFNMSLDTQGDGTKMKNVFRKQLQLTSMLSILNKQVKTAKLSEVDDMLLKGLQKIDISEGLPLPIDPSIVVNGFDYSACKVMNSNARPFKLVFRTEKEGESSTVLFKSGDDLRQDMFFMQMLQFIDDLLQEENFNLELTPYRVLATSKDEGFVQFVLNSATLSDIGKKSSVLQYLKTKKRQNIDDSARLGVNSRVMERYLRSCAGYCVVTYIFGVGDRHAHNLMLTADGNFFHIDFGYLFGREPTGKVYQPLFKLSSTMTEGMGGVGSYGYNQFVKYCCEAFNRVRSEAPLIIALTALVSEASFINNPGPSITVKVADKFALELNDHQAEVKFTKLIEACAKSSMGKLADAFHELMVS